MIGSASITLWEAMFVVVPMVIGYALGLCTSRQPRWSPQRHTRQHYTDRRRP